MQQKNTFSRKTQTIHTTASWTEYNIEYYHYRPTGFSKTIYLQAWLHGTEIVWTPILYELLQKIETEQLSHRIIIVPIANPFSLDSQIMWLQTWYNNIHTNASNCLNYNRLWHWNTTPFEAHIVKSLLDISQNADIVCDLHCAWYESAEHIYCHTDSIDLAKKFSIDNIITWQEPWSAFEDTQHTLWKKAFTLELGASRSTSKQRVTWYTDHIMKFLKHLDQNANKNTSETTYAGPIRSQNQLSSFYAPYGWVLVWHSEIWKRYKAGDLAAKIYTIAGIKDIHRNKDSLFLIKNAIHAPYADQEIAQYLEM